MCTRFYVEPDTEEIREIIAEVQRSQLRKKIEAYCAKYGDSDSANIPDVVFWAGVYKAICEIKNAPEEKVQIARTWLKAHGFSASIS